MESQNPKYDTVKSRCRSPAPPRRSHADHRHPLKSSPGPEVLKGLSGRCLVKRSAGFSEVRTLIK
eukprot:8827061-Alexandrium_andersonii.AAC.1